MAFAAKFWNSPALGELRATGGLPTPGRATNGTSRSPMARSTASARIPAAGSWKEVTIEADCSSGRPSILRQIQRQFDGLFNLFQSRLAQRAQRWINSIGLFDRRHLVALGPRIAIQAAFASS